MKFTIPVADFREAFNTASYALDKVKNAGVTCMMLLQAEKKAKSSRVLFFATDGVAAIVKKADAVIEETGQVLIEPKEVATAVSNLKDESILEFTYQDGVLQLKCGRFKPKCTTDDATVLAARFKQLPLSAKPNLEIPAWKLKEVFERIVGFANVKEENLSQAFMQNIYLRTSDKGLEAYSASDGIVAKGRVNGLVLPEDTDFKVNIPARAVPALQKILSNPAFKLGEDADKVPKIRLVLQETEGGGNLYVRTDDIFYGVGLRNDKIPQKAIDSEASMKTGTNAGIQLNREEFIAAVKRCRPFLGGNLLRITLKSNQLTILDSKQEELDVLAGTGEEDGESKTCLDSQLLLSVLSSAKEEIIALRFLKNKAAVLLNSGVPETGRGFYVVIASQDPFMTEEKPA